MPIHHCMKCGLKVLIDETQATASPFYCQRCATSLKTDGPRRETTFARVVPTTTPPAPTPTVKVLCPYCSTAFNSRMPQKPAKGTCPLCKKELILLPNGEIRAAAGFDIVAWQRENEGSRPPATAPKTDTGLRPVTVEPPMATTPAPAPGNAPGDSGLPSWLDDDPAPAATAPAPRAAGGDSLDGDSAVIVDVDPSGTDVRVTPVEDAPAAPPPPEPAPAAPPQRKPSTLRTGTGVRPTPLLKKPEATEEEEPLPTGGGAKVVVAWILFVIAMAAGPALWASRDKIAGKPLERIGARFAKGFQKIHDRLVPPPAPPTPVVEPVSVTPPAPPPEDLPPDPAARERAQKEISRLHGELMMMQRKYKENTVGATEEQKSEFEKVKEDLEKRTVQIEELRKDYRKTFKEDYDPSKGDLK